jgi:hypothetical protein
VKQRPHRTSDDLGVPEVNRARHGEDRRCVECRRRSKDGADVSGILHRIERDDAGAFRELDVVEATRGDLGDGEDALGRVGLGRAGELALVDVGDVDAAAPRGIEEGGSTRCIGQLRSDEDSPHGMADESSSSTARTSLGDEQLLALAGPPSPEVAC